MDIEKLHVIETNPAKEQFILLMPVLNPVLYSLLGKKFRVEFVEYLKRKSASRPSSFILSRVRGDKK